MTEPRVREFVAHIRRLASDGALLYVQVGAKDVRRLALETGQHVAVALARVSINGIFKTSGGSAWLAPGNSTNAVITYSLRRAGFEHGNDVPARIRLTGPSVLPANNRISVSGERLASPPVRAAQFRIDAAVAVDAVRAYNADSYRGEEQSRGGSVAYEQLGKRHESNAAEAMSARRSVWRHEVSL